MKALVYQAPKVLEVVERPQPVPQKGELLLQVKACGICGSDVHGYLGITGRRTPPMVMGHEFSATVAGLGESTNRGFTIGQRVVVQPCISCWECEKCKEGYNNVCPTRDFIGVLDCDGALQEYLCVPEKLVYTLPDEISDEAGALIEALAVSYSGIKKAGKLTGKNVVIIGGGTIGLLALLVAKTQNPKKIIVSDLSDYRLATAKKLGADVTINPKDKDFVQEIKNAFDGELADVSIEAVGVKPTVEQALSALKEQGTCVWIGNSAKMVEINMQDVVTRELKIFGSYIYTHEEFGEVIEFIQKNKLDLSQVISKKVPLEQAATMFQELAEHSEKYLKCIVTL